MDTLHYYLRRNHTLVPPIHPTTHQHSSQFQRRHPIRNIPPLELLRLKRGHRALRQQRHIVRRELAIVWREPLPEAHFRVPEVRRRRRRRRALCKRRLGVEGRLLCEGRCRLRRELGRRLGGKLGCRLVGELGRRLREGRRLSGERG